jgi:hypothetical protein
MSERRERKIIREISDLSDDEVLQFAELLQKTGAMALHLLLAKTGYIYAIGDTDKFAKDLQIRVRNISNAR